MSRIIVSRELFVFGAHILCQIRKYLGQGRANFDTAALILCYICTHESILTQHLLVLNATAALH